MPDEKKIEYSEWLVYRAEGKGGVALGEFRVLDKSWGFRNGFHKLGFRAPNQVLVTAACARWTVENDPPAKQVKAAELRVKNRYGELMLILPFSATAADKIDMADMLNYVLVPTEDGTTVEIVDL